MVITAIFIIAISVVLAINRDSHLPKDPVVRKWLAVTLGYYVFDFLMMMFQYGYVNKN